MKLLSSALTLIFLFSCVSMGVVLADKGALMSCGGIIGWAFASVLCFLVIAICCTPVLLVLAVMDMMFRRITGK